MCNICNKFTLYFIKVFRMILQFKICSQLFPSKNILCFLFSFRSIFRDFYSNFNKFFKIKHNFNQQNIQNSTFLINKFSFYIQKTRLVLCYWFFFCLFVTFQQILANSLLQKANFVLQFRYTLKFSLFFTPESRRKT